MAEATRKKTVCLAMIVKNEGHLIIETFNHLAKFIKFDYWVINDNGSTDGTQDLIRNYFKEKGIPGELDETPWRDFAYNRTVAFNVAYKKTDYVFVWDADDEIAGDFKFPTVLNADSYKFIFGNEGGLRYSRCQLFNNHLKWHYVGVLHEYPACLEASGPTSDVNGDYFFISGRKGDRSKDPDKYLKDALILEKAFHEAYEKKDGIYNRYAFYTAQSYNSCGRHEKAIEYYKKVLTLDNWLQEKYFSCLEIYDQYEHLKKEEEGLRFLVESFRYDRKRVECIYRLVKYYCIKGLNDVSYAYYTLIQEYYETQYVKDDISLHLFAKKEEYDFYLPYYMVIVSDRIQRFDTAAKMLAMIFKQNYLYSGPWWIHNLFHNIQFSIQAFPKDLGFLESMLTYINNLRARNVNLTVDNYKNVDKIITYYRPLLTAPFERVIPTKPLFSQGKVRVMLTVTTCKRFDLFEQTMNSMKRNWLDLDKVDYFFCVDDNSSVEDRMKMQTQYPFFNYYMKAADEKGHRESMNIIYDKLKEVQPTYWIHMEDDWVYFKAENYVSKGIQMLEKYKDQQIHQLVYNRTYGLMMEDMKRVGGRLLEQGIWLHEQKEVEGPNCAYWPHYSLQPSIIRAEVILELGNYDSPNKFFERDYANKYGAKGYQTMFFDSINSLHIGKQHWETDGKNAYALNEVGQFNIGALTQKVVEVKEKLPNVPLTGSMKDHLEQIIAKIESGTHFGLIRPSDGEHTVLKGDTLTNCDGWTFSKGSVLQQQLLNAIQTVNQNLYIGIPCNTCNKPWNCTDEIYNNFIDTWKVPMAQRTYANLVGNSNWKRFSDFMKSYSKGFFLITSGTMATNLPVKERFIIDSKLVNQWDTLGVGETERLKKFIANKKDQLICFSAGPLSKYWIPLCMKLNPNNMYLDVGASLDIFMKGQTNRSYTNLNHPFSKERCTFKDCLGSMTLVPKSKNLLYMCVFNNKDYVELLKILLVTLKLFSNLDGIDILVLTSANLAPLIDDISSLTGLPIFMKICEFTEFHECVCARFTIFDYQYISQYEKILYIDTDIIIQNDVSKIFATEIEEKIYALPEGTIEHEYHGGWFFDFETIDKNTVGMNSGILYFKNTDKTRGIFKDINEHTKRLRDAKENLPTTVDQPFLNYHAIKGGNQDTKLLTDFALIYCMDPPPPPSAPTTVSLCHFVWPIGNANHKKNRMIKHMDHVFNHYMDVYKTSPPEESLLLGKTYKWDKGYGTVRFEKDKLVTTWAIGEYKWLDSHTLELNWSGYSHLVRMNDVYDSFLSVRKGDFNVGTGDLLVV